MLTITHPILHFAQTSNYVGNPGNILLDVHEKVFVVRQKCSANSDFKDFIFDLTERF